MQSQRLSIYLTVLTHLVRHRLHPDHRVNSGLKNTASADATATPTHRVSINAHSGIFGSDCIYAPFKRLAKEVGVSVQISAFRNTSMLMARTI